MTDKTTNDTLRERPVQAEVRLAEQRFLSGHSYYAKHKPTGEDWYILGIDVKCNRVCAAGYPATIGDLSDCEKFEINAPLTDQELTHRKKHFGENWL